MPIGVKVCHIGSTMLLGHGSRSGRDAPRRYVRSAGSGNGGRHTGPAGSGRSEIRLDNDITALLCEKIAISSQVGYALAPVDPEQLKPGLWDQSPPMCADFDYSRVPPQFCAALNQERLIKEAAPVGR